MDFGWILVAFVCGFAFKLMGLPALIGYLLAGFSLNAFGVEPFQSLNTLADLGITLLLFTIGLKLDVRQLARLDVAGTALTHTLLWLAITTPIFLLLTFLGSQFLLGMTIQTAALLTFALSFSSTVCVIKALEEKSELKTRQGKLAVGILVIQDIVAVLFLAIAAGKTPSLFALLLLLLIPARPLLQKLLAMTGHDELLPLAGFLFALGGAELFELVKMKGDLGALVMGMLLASSKKSSELYKALMSFKDLFLIGFFLSIGFTALPTPELIGWALLLCGALVVKFALFFAILISFGLRGRTAFLAGVALSNYSEFGLIVAAISVDKGWLGGDWLVVIALAVAISFVISSFFYRGIHTTYAKLQPRIQKLQRASSLRSMAKAEVSQADVLILGMGRVGTGAYDALNEDYPGRVWGVESDSDRVARKSEAGYQMVMADADDYDFWESQDLRQVKLIMLALPSISEMESIISLIKRTGYGGRIAAIARYDDERESLLALGADVVFNYYAEVGAGFADESRHLIEMS